MSEIVQSDPCLAESGKGDLWTMDKGSSHGKSWGQNPSSFPEPVIDQYVDFRLHTLFLHTLFLKIHFTLFVVIVFALLPLGMSIVLSLLAHLVVTGFQSTWIINHDCDLEREKTVGALSLTYLTDIIRGVEKSPDDYWRIANDELSGNFQKSRDEHSYAGNILEKSFKFIGQIALNLVIIGALGWVGVLFGEFIGPWLGQD